MAPAMRPTSTMSTPTETMPAAARLVRAVQAVHDLHQIVDVVQVVIGARVLRTEGVAVAREGRSDAQLRRSHHVPLRPIPHHDGLGRRDVQKLQRPREGLRAGYSIPSRSYTR